MKRVLQRALVTASLLVHAGFSLLAQSIAPAALSAPAPTDKKPAEEVVTLNEFSVSANQEHGYVASETMSGSRINTKIIDLPYSTVNLTNEFFEDFGILELNESLTYIGGLTNLGIGGTFNLRGFSSTSQLRDGFYRLGRYGQSNVERLEIIRGPNAAIYGRSSPGGMVNMISKQPKPEEAETITVDNGSFGQRREKLEATGSVLPGSGGRTYYVLTLSQYERNYPGEYDHIRNYEGYLALKHDFVHDAHLMVTAEYFLQVQHSPTVAPPMITDQKGTTSTADDVVIGYATKLSEYSPYGPHSELNRSNITWTTSYDKKFNDVWSFRAAAQYFRARRWDFNVNTGWGAITINSPTTSLITSARGNLPSKNLIMEDGGGLQSDLLAHYSALNGKVDNKTLFTVDFNDYYRWDPSWNFGPTNTNPDLIAWNAVRTVTLNPGDYTPAASSLPIAYFPKNFQWGQETLGGLRRYRTSSLGGNFKQQSFWWNGRLITYFGTRYDVVRYSDRDYLLAFNSFGTPDKAQSGKPGGSVVRRLEHETKPNLGFNFALTPEFRLYGSYSQSYFVDQTLRPNVVADPNFQPETANGVDYGIKGSFFGERLNFTLGGYYINRHNVSVSDYVESPVGSGNFVVQTLYDGSQLVRGWESDLSWNVTPNFSVGSSFAVVNSKYTDFGSNFPEVIGRSVNGVTPENGGGYMKYDFTHGALKGLSANLLATYVSSTPSEVPNAGDTVGTVNGQRVVTASTYQWKLRIPSFTVWSAGLRYRLPRLNNYNQTLGLNVGNIFNKFYLKTNKTLGDTRSILISYSISRTPGR